jgi:Fic family protein
VVPMIATASAVLPGAVCALVDDAAAEVARFDAEMGGEIAPFAALLLRSESAASSKIENLTASARAVAEAEIGISARRNAAEIVANTSAMNAAIGLADHLDSEAILAMHRALMIGKEPEIAGRWRDEQVWIGGGNLSPHGADFVPPHHSRLGPGIADLVTFLGRDDLPVLIHAATAHAHFETLHPFPDGNGRTGRALVHALLRNKRLVRNVTVPVSAGLLVNIDSYFAALGSYRDGDLEPIVAAFAHAAFSSVDNGRILVSDLRGLRDSWAERITARSDSAAWKVCDLLLRHPVINAPLAARELAIPVRNVYRALGPLESAEVIVEFTDQRRGRAWRAVEVLDALDAFAARAGRRGRTRSR